MAKNAENNTVHRPTELEINDLGLIGYDDCLEIQKAMVHDRVADNAPDSLLIVSHPPVVTIGKSGSDDDLHLTLEQLRNQGVQVCHSDRGGKSTYHGPGQLVAYPILKLQNRDVHRYVQTLLNVVASVLIDHGLKPEFRPGLPGVWVNQGKIASIGVSLKKWVTYHGVALNVNMDLSGFDSIIPCGVAGQKITSMKSELHRHLDYNKVKKSFILHFEKAFGYSKNDTERRPEWLKVAAKKTDQVSDIVSSHNLETVCQRAMCPNLDECFSKGTATFMILGRYCTRNCRFCAVEQGDLLPPDPDEPERVAAAVKQMALDYAVITSVTRDDLPDGGAAHFVRTIGKLREACPETRIEVLVPDFRGDRLAIDAVCGAKPDMFNHNVETVPRLSALVRPQASYHRSLAVLTQAARSGVAVKSGLMLGLGESRDEVKETLVDLLLAGCTNVTIGQYLAPSKQHLPVARYILPAEFEEWERYAKGLGFQQVVASPLARSSYNASAFFEKAYQPKGD